ncbi:2-oxoacid:acceptor oxidoreductase subunit alpha [Kouleothrix sp.]|uniref:2-oxoacid:acceptor oxidoreductase subunit alpha n=1 Tax=Kouleothrix sp. TaxID=2779161 RepID=UPI00391D4989
MSVIEAQPATRPASVDARGPIVNDFAIVAATVNGSGSQTANNTLIRAIFKMGVPVSGKNLFPSNIAGLPTWYTIRVSKQGYIARREGTEIVVAFNAKTADDDLAALPPGGVCVHPDDIKFANPRADVTSYAVPLKELLKQVNPPSKLKDYVANMAYVGVLVELLSIDMDEIVAALNYHFHGKASAINLNLTMVEAARAWAREHLVKSDPYRVERMNLTAGQILIDGNSAAGLGALMGGVTVVAWYPITPSTSLIDAVNEYAPQLRRDPDTGKPTYAIVQAEDELAAIGMVVGAGWAGARSMTATSGPGISLMTEFAGIAYFAEVPAVIWDVQRMGPSTGLPTRVSQGDVLTAYTLGHGDTRHVCLLPGTMRECFEFGYTAFDLAERLQTPVFVLSDLDLGMNNWMTEPFDYPAQPLDRGKVLSADELKQVERWGRYLDIDGDGIPYRTLPGNTNARGAYLSRGTGHNEFGQYSEKPADWQNNLDRLSRKHDTARKLVPAPVVDEVAGARVGIIAYGSTDAAVQEGRDRLRDGAGIATSYMRLRALPLGDAVSEFVAKYERVYVIELNQDGQMHQLVQLHAPEQAGSIRSVRICNGLPLSARFVAEAIVEQERQ